MNKQNIYTQEEIMTRAEYYKYIADETFKIHCNQLANFTNKFINL